MNRIKNSLNRLKVKRKFNDFLNYNKEESIGINIIEKYAKNNYVIVSPTFEDYVKGNRPKKRQLIKLLIQIINFFCVLRLGVSAIFHDKWIVSIMSDANHMLGNKTFISGSIAMAFFQCCFSIGGLVHYMDMKSTLHCVSLLVDIKNKTVEYPLNSKYRQRFCIQLRFLSTILLKHIHHTIEQFDQFFQ